jgi:diguanylate cyclase (GGDEF)-like protein/PAS domain S-box-containing protein
MGPTARLRALPRRLRPAAALGAVVPATALGFLYFLLAELSVSLVGAESVPVLWLASGLYVGVLLSADRRRWPLLALAALGGSFAANLAGGNSPEVSLAFAVPNSAEGFFAALVVRRLSGGGFDPGRVRDVAALALGGAVIANGVTALAAAAAASQAFSAPFAGSWLRWWAADGLGMLAVAPLAAAPLATLLRLPSRAELDRVVPVLLGLVPGAAVIAASHPAGAATVVGGAIAAPVLLLTGRRYGPRPATAAGLGLLMTAAYFASRDSDPFAYAAGLSTHVLVIQAFLAVLLLGSLTFAAATAEHRRSEGLLGDTRRRLRGVVETVPDAYISFDAAGRITEWSPAAEAMLGWPREEVLGRRVAETIVSQSGREEWAAELLRRTGADAEARRLSCRDRSGRELPVELTVSPDAHHLFVRDVSERERLRAEVDRLRGELARATTRAERLGAELGLKESELGAAAREQERLGGELARSAAGRARTELELANTAAARERTQRQLEQASRERARLEADASALRHELARAEQRAERVARELDHARGELARTREALGEARRLAEEARERLERTQAELDHVRGESEQRRTELVRARDESEARRAELVRARDESEQRRAELVRARGESEHRRAELERARGHFERTRAELDEVRRDAERTREELTRVGAERRQFGAERGILRLELERTQAARQEAERAAEGAERALEESRSALDESRSALEASSSELEATAAQLADALRDRELLEERGGEVIARYDDRGICRYVSPACRPLLGYEPEELVGRPGAELLHPDDGRLVQAARAADSESRFEVRLRRKDGALAWLQAAVRPVRDAASGRLVELHASLRDISDRRGGQARLDALFRAAPVGMALMAPDGRLEEVNPAFRELTGYSAGQLDGAGLVTIVHPEDGDAFLAALRRLRANELRSHRSEHRLLHADGRVLTIGLSLAVVGESGQLVAQLLDLSQRAAAQQEVARLTDHDPLTGLFNRTRFVDELRRELASGARYGTRGSVLVADLDGFMDVNGLVGRSAGDELLARVGDALRRRLRSTDLLARAGGDQFAVWLPRAAEPQARHVAKALLEVIREVGAAELRNTPLRLTASLGIAPQRDGEPGAEELLVEAEIAVQDAKQAGGDRASVFDPAGGGPAAMRERLGWAERIRQAIDHGGLVLHAQPVVSLAGEGSAPRYELLPRMLGESGELVPAGAFLPVAERFGLAAEIDRWVLGKAIALLRDERRSIVEVALSARSLTDPGLPSFIAERLAAAGAEAGRLCVTIPETAAIGGGDRAGLFTRRLADLGCEVGLDRFGAGLASFRHVEHLSVGYLKIDAGLVESLRTSVGSRLVLRSMAEVARGLGRQTSARSVPDPESLALVRDAGIDYAQGPAVGRARPFEELGARHLHVA